MEPVMALMMTGGWISDMMIAQQKCSLLKQNIFPQSGSFAKRNSLKAFIRRKWCKKTRCFSSEQTRRKGVLEKKKEKKLLLSNLQSELLCAETLLALIFVLPLN